MSKVTVTITNVCAGGNHLTFSITGDASGSMVIDLPDLLDPITSRDVESFIRVIARLAKKGRTVNQAKALLQAGIQVTV